MVDTFIALTLPRGFTGRLAGCDVTVTRQVLRGNTAGLPGLGLA